MPTARAITLADLAAKHNWTLGVELGVYEGATSDYLLSNVRHLHMIGVDVWQPIEGGPKDKTTGHSPKSGDVIREAKRKAYVVFQKHEGRFTIMQRRTVEAADFVADSGVDFVFVDASHVTAHVVNDVRAWLPKVRSGGMILGHDADWPAIQRALAELSTYYEAFTAVEYFDGNVWGVRV